MAATRTVDRFSLNATQVVGYGRLSAALVATPGGRARRQAGRGDTAAQGIQPVDRRAVSDERRTQPREARLLVPWPVEPWCDTGDDMGGLGDAIGEARIVPYVARHSPGATLAVRRPLVRLFSRLGLPVVAFADVDPAAYQTGGSLTAFLSPGVRLPRFDEMALPPLWADPSIRLGGAQARLRVGLCWHGSGGGRSAVGIDDDPRCIRPEVLRPLVELPTVEWVGLQLADHSRDLPIQGLPDVGVCDFADTAGILKQLDLVITIDTSIAHVAGNLGVPTWLLLQSPQSPGWDGGRWDCTPPLYETVRQFRQPTPGDWTSVVGRIAAELAAFRARSRCREPGV